MHVGMHAGIPNYRFPLKSMAGKTFPALPAPAQPAILMFLLRGPCPHQSQTSPARTEYLDVIVAFCSWHVSWFICYTLETIFRKTIVVSRTRTELNKPLMVCVPNLAIPLNIAHSLGFHCKSQYVFVGTNFFVIVRNFNEQFQKKVWILRVGKSWRSPKQYVPWSCYW